MKTNNENWVLLYSCIDDIKLEKIKHELNAEKIPFTIVNKKDSNFLIGEYEIYVPVEFLGKSKLILKGIDVNID